MTGAYQTTEKTAGPWVDIDLNALCANYRMVCDAAPGAKIAAVVKCDAYGLGMEAVATTLAKSEHCDEFFVAYPEEGVALRAILKDAAPHATIYVFNGPLPQTMALFKSANLTPVLNSLEQAKKWAERMPGVAAALHADTGMNRLGAPAKDIQAIAHLSDLNITLLMSHLASPSLDESQTGNAKNEKQKNLFHAVAAHFPDAQKSLSASGGALMAPDYHFDLIRTGIALYGSSPFDKDDVRIKPVASLRAPIVQIRDLTPGETVGYGAAFSITRPSRIATVALGYGDGFPRIGWQKAKAAITGGIAPIAGRISMDLISLDITDIASSIQTGDIATFFGGEIRLFEAAATCDTIPYELLTGLGGRVDRRYL